MSTECEHDWRVHPGITLAVVPPQLDAPRTLTVSEVTERAENEALVFFDEVSDLSSAELLAGFGGLGLHGSAGVALLRFDVVAI